MKMMMALVGLVLVAISAIASPVVRNYRFKLVNGKPGVIPGYNLPSSYHMGLTNPNPADTGAGIGHQYLAIYCKAGNYDQRILLFHRNDVTPFDDFQGKNSQVAQINAGNDLTPQDDGRRGSVEGPVLRVFQPIGRMTHENYWISATGSSTGPFNEWQPRDARPSSPLYNQFLVYPDGTGEPDGLGVNHTTSANDDWGCPGYNKKGSTYVETVDAGLPTEKIRGITFGTFWTSPYNWGAGMFEVGPWTPPADPMTELGTRTRISKRMFMTQSDLDALVPDASDAFRSWFADGKRVFFLTAGAGDNKIYLSAVEITDWTNGTWQQVDISSGPEMYQSFTFDSGNPDTSLFDSNGLVFAPDPTNPGNPPLLYLNNTKRRIFVLEAEPPQGTRLLIR